MNEKLHLWKKGDPIGYICRDIPEFKVPPYKGERYEALVPDTLDLAERAALAVNGLTGPTDPQADYELYFLVNFKSNPPHMKHSADDPDIQAKFQQALPLMRIISGSCLNEEVDRRWMEVTLHRLGPDGLAYIPVVGRPWARGSAWGSTEADNFVRPIACGILLSAMSLYYLRSKDPVWKEAIEKMVTGLTNLSIDKNSYAYFPEGAFSAGESTPRDAKMPTGITSSLCGWVVLGLVHAYRVTSLESALRLASKLLRYIMERGQYFAPDGTFLPNQYMKGLPAPHIHFHHHTSCVLAMAEYALVAKDAEVAEYAKKCYQYAKSKGDVLIGYFPENIDDNRRLWTSEMCDVADMLAIAVKLTQAEVGDYWEDIDRWVRNQFAEGQLVDTEWIELISSKLPLCPVTGPGISNERVIERNIGAFAGWPSANEWIGCNIGIMHCCTGNSTRAIYYLWENIVTYQNGKLKINLLLNRASPWADVNSYIPYEGRVDVKIKEACDLSIRIPKWANLEQTHCQVNNLDRPLSWEGLYAKVGPVTPHDVVTLNFPIVTQKDKVEIEKRSYTIQRKGNEVVLIDPPGKCCP